MAEEEVILASRFCRCCLSYNFFSFYHSFDAAIKFQKKIQPNTKIDIDLNDPEVGKAAVKIQAGFKTFMASKNKKNKEESEEIKQPKQQPDSSSEKTKQTNDGKAIDESLVSK